MLRDLFLKLENGICVKLTESSNGPVDEDCDGAIGIYAYDENGNEVGDCGEMDYKKEDYASMQDAVKDMLLFAELPILPYEEISEDEFYERVG